MNTFNNFGELESLLIAGSGPGSSGAPPSPTEEDDSIYSKQTIKVLFAVSEGEIPDTNDQGDLRNEIYLNDLKLKTFKKCSYDMRPGSATQTYIPGFEEVESPIAMVAKPLYKDTNPDSNILAISKDFTAVRIIITFDSSYYQDRDGNKKKVYTGIKVFSCPDEEGNFTQQKFLEVTEKSSGPFSIQCRVERPATHNGITSWRVKVKRVSPDAKEYHDPLPGYDGYLVNKTTWTQTIGLSHYQSPKTYPNTALLSLVLKNAIRLGNTMPDVIFRMYGIKVRIPGNYNPSTRTYTGIWDGNWLTDGIGQLKKEYTCNPAWCIYDILVRTKQEGGLGIPESDINRYSFYYLSQICDQLVATEYNGQSVTSRRYEIHNCFDVREPAKNILTYMLALCDSIFGTDEFGLLTIIPDAPASASEIVTNGDVIDGVFEYSSNDLEDRVSYVNVTYNNPDDRGRTTTVTVPDNSPTTEEQEIEARYGYRGADIVLVGCASRQQAIRKGRWYLYSNSKTTGFLSFKTFMRGISLRLGKVINVLDSDNQNVKQQGRILSYTIDYYTILQLDRDVDQTSLPGNGILFKVCYYSASGYVEVSGFMNWGISHSKVYTINGPVPVEGSIFVLFGEIQPTTWKISAIDLDTETHIHTITCTQYSADKFTYIDSGVLIDPPLPIQIKDLDTPPVYDIRAYKEYYTDSLGSHANLVLVWKWPDLTGLDPADWTIQPYDASFQLLWQRDENMTTTVDNISRMEYRIEQAAPGYYSGKLYAYNPKLMRSEAVTWAYDFGSQPGVSDLLPPHTARTEDYAKGLTTNSVEFLQQECVILFEYNTSNDEAPTDGTPPAGTPATPGATPSTENRDVLFDYLIEVWADNVKRNTYICPIVTAKTVLSEGTGVLPGLKGGRFAFEYSKNLETFKRISPFLPRREITFKIFSRDCKGDLSASSLNLTVNNYAPPAVPTVEVLRTYNHIRIKLDWGEVPTPVDLQYYLVTMTPTTVADSAAALNGSAIYRGLSKEISIPLADNTPAYFHVAAVDRFGETGLTFKLNNSVSGYLNELIETVGAWEADSVPVNYNTATTIISGTVDVPFQAPAVVNVKVSCCFSCPLQLVKVRFGLHDGNTQHWKEVYARSGNTVDSRYWSGSAMFTNIAMPYGASTFTVTTEVKHLAVDGDGNPISPVSFRDVFQDSTIRLA